MLKDESRIGIDDFISKSFLSYLLGNIVPSNLRTDTRYFSLMGDDSVKLTFFREYVSFMRERIPSFGECCYVDSTPLPNNMENNPFNYLCSHGLRGCDVKMRLVLILDDATQLPVWYTIIPGNLSDCNTINSIQDDVFSSLGITISKLILDAGYITHDFLQVFNNSSDKTFIGRMPFRKGFPHRNLYQIVRPLIGKGKYTFVRSSHQYFDYVKEDIEIAGQKVNAYVYVDIPNATKTLTAYIEKHEEEYENLKDKDKDYKNIEGGFFILLSNKKTSPKELLDKYFTRTGIEDVFKTAKTYLDLLPIAKCSDVTVRGKILSDIISLIILLEFRKQLQNSKTSVSSILGATQSLMCLKKLNGNVLVEAPNKQTKEAYLKLSTTIPSSIKLSSLKHKFLFD